MNKLPTLNIAALFAFVALAGGGGATFWSHSLSKKVEQEYRTIFNQVPAESKLKSDLAESEAKVSECRMQLQHLEQGVPQLAYVPTLLTELESVGKSHAISVTGVRPVPENKFSKATEDKKVTTEKKAYQEMIIDITGRGSFDKVMEMIDALKKFPKIIAVQSVSLTPKKEVAANAIQDPNVRVTPRLEASVKIKAYLFPQPKTDDDKKKPSGGTS